MNESERAAIRTALANMVAAFRPEDLRALEKLVGQRLDAGAFTLGMQVAALCFAGVNPLLAVALAPEELRGTLDAVRAKMRAGEN